MNDDLIRAAARDRLGFAELHPGQLEGVRSVLAGRDTLCVMSTGSGKTAIYELAGLLLDGPTIVVSPLIALQRDQVRELGQGSAAVFNSAESQHARDQALTGVAAGSTRFLLMAPEQLEKEDVRRRIRELAPALFVVDEAHCVSEWGHDFRPSYLDLAATIEAVGRPPVLALTATASPPVRADITRVLGMREPELVVRGFDRPNIHLSVRAFHHEHDKREALLSAVLAAKGPGIVYVATRRGAEDVATTLTGRGMPARAYHAGLPAAKRREVQDAFIAEHHCNVIVATVAFGMGIDKPDVRWVMHEQISGSVDAYYQEIGRAGRDGTAVGATLFYRVEDLGLRRFFVAGEGAGPEDGRREFDLSRVEMSRAYAERRGCRRAFLLAYFGEDFTPPCGNCDNCDAGRGTHDLPPAGSATPFTLGDRVLHSSWGQGTVGQIAGGQITVVFDNVGYKTLSLDLVRERCLLMNTKEMRR